jgi:thiamine-phosphate pyrophosphorylase
MSKETLRIIDVNLNRASEGLRFLEEIARFQLNDAALSEQLKTVRHEVVRGDVAFNEQLLNARDSAGDVGVDITVASDDKQRDLPTAVVANARRIQESLRVLEELSKTPGLPVGMTSDTFMHARFNLYTIEQKLISRLTRLDKKKLISGLYVILDSAFLKGRRHADVAIAAIKGGARIIQLRDKQSSRRDLLTIAQEVRQVCVDNRVLFLVNDHIDIALASNADGVHLGTADLPIAEARRLLPLGKIIGATVATVAHAKAAEASGADYVSVAAVYLTTSKYVEVVGVDRAREIKQVVSLPVVAVGGINKDNVASVIEAGADAVGVISAVMGAADTEGAARQIADVIDQCKGK